METIEWLDDVAAIRMIDQTLLPYREKYIVIRRVDDLTEAIRVMRIRGAPAIGVAAAMGMALGAARYSGKNGGDFIKYMDEVAKKLIDTRPTASNLFWAVERQHKKLHRMRNRPVEQIRKSLVSEAKKIHREDIAANRKMGEFGAKLLRRGSVVITHCNAGSLATGGYGTAVGVIRTAARRGLISKVYVSETRPRLQGARLTAFELLKYNIPATLICDSVAGSLMAQGKINCAIVGADRIAANGDFANKIGTYSLSVNANAHGIPFYTAAPVSTIDLSVKSGSGIPIEYRPDDEVRRINGALICPRTIPVLNPAFDVTPARLVTAIITERGVCYPPYKNSLKNLFNGTS
ncbi:MAG: S-methyl-5-thioribose-1-phosphate isomerase [bacterium]